MSRLNYIFLFLFFPLFLAAQKDSVDVKKEIVINNKRFRVYNSWVSGGVGLAYHSVDPRTQTMLGVNFNFHIKQYYFRLGTMFSGDVFGLWNNFQAHACWIPYRTDQVKYHLAMMAGASYSTGYPYLYAGTFDNIHPYKETGLYLEVQYIRKLFFDVGGGGALFANINKQNTIIGVRADIYLSGAYKGYVKGKEPHHM
ncbi:MAG TPA: hypothetical protein VFU15_09950 [Bacteroidia bacterium]|nr:hypothetical protein [Bacteroidia bacterium]